MPLFTKASEVEEHFVSFLNSAAIKKFNRLSKADRQSHIKNAYEYARLIGDIAYIEAYAEEIELYL